VRHDVEFGGRYFFTTRARTHGSESISNATIGRDRTRDRTSSAPSRARVAPHSFTHTFAMLAQKFTVSAKAVATTKHTVAKRGNSIVRRNSKGGEEGAVRRRRRRRREARATDDGGSIRIAQRAYNNDAFGMIAKAASYSLFGAAITKVRRRKTRARATACG